MPCEPGNEVAASAFPLLCGVGRFIVSVPGASPGGEHGPPFWGHSRQASVTQGERSRGAPSRPPPAVHGPPARGDAGRSDNDNVPVALRGAGGSDRVAFGGFAGVRFRAPAFWADAGGEVLMRLKGQQAGCWRVRGAAEGVAPRASWRVGLPHRPSPRGQLLCGAEARLPSPDHQNLRTGVTPSPEPASQMHPELS